MWIWAALMMLNTAQTAPDRDDLHGCMTVSDGSWGRGVVNWVPEERSADRHQMMFYGTIGEVHAVITWHGAEVAPPSDTARLSLSLPVSGARWGMKLEVRRATAPGEPGLASEDETIATLRKELSAPFGWDRLRALAARDPALLLVALDEKGTPIRSAPFDARILDQPGPVVTGMRAEVARVSADYRNLCRLLGPDEEI